MIDALLTGMSRNVFTVVHMCIGYAVCLKYLLMFGEQWLLLKPLGLECMLQYREIGLRLTEVPLRKIVDQEGMI